MVDLVGYGDLTNKAISVTLTIPECGVDPKFLLSPKSVWRYLWARNRDSTCSLHPHQWTDFAQNPTVDPVGHRDLTNEAISVSFTIPKRGANPKFVASPKSVGRYLCARNPDEIATVHAFYACTSGPISLRLARFTISERGANPKFVASPKSVGRYLRTRNPNEIPTVHALHTHASGLISLKLAQ
ncbi:hypothetical protein V495_08308 [Pseudogymnoascus sp. VKM F-4514 (FW-929)]|nr:hypothetical protein V495_08308 [Pseudogymnoascus sp. VKM F-4514 (FW-929)]KFY66004.1 hypothetical protein V497_01193 [Pseudogymnoascus sp. VKM F-4516 (FW-969)]